MAESGHRGRGSSRGCPAPGRSTAAKCLEDLGCFVVDNLPPALIADHGRPGQPRLRRGHPDRGGGRRAQPRVLRGPAQRDQGARRAGLPAAGAVPRGGRRRAGPPVRARPARHPLQGGGRLVDGIAAERELLAAAARDRRPGRGHQPAVRARPARQLERAFGERAAPATAGHGALLRLQVRPADGRRPRRRRAVPAQPALDPGAAPAYRPGRGRPRLRAEPGGRRAIPRPLHRAAAPGRAPATSARASAT